MRQRQQHRLERADVERQVRRQVGRCQGGRGRGRRRLERGGVRRRVVTGVGAGAGCSASSASSAYRRPSKRSGLGGGERWSARLLVERRGSEPLLERRGAPAASCSALPARRSPRPVRERRQLSRPAAAPGSEPPIALVRLTGRRILAPEAADTGRSTPT